MPSTSACSSSRSGLSLYLVPSKLTVTVFSSGSASRAWSRLRACVGRQPADLDVADPHPVGDLVRVRAVDGVRAHGQHEQRADGGREGYLDSASHVVKRSYPAKMFEEVLRAEQV